MIERSNTHGGDSWNLGVIELTIRRFELKTLLCAWEYYPVNEYREYFD